MTPARWQQIKDIFDSALDVSTAARRSFLVNACPDDAELREEVERLLHQHDTAGDFLEQPVIQAASLSEGEMVSKRYRIGKLLGRGGMGEVYEAHDQFLNETIAIKTLRADLSRNETVVRRFQREIQLARKVTHPNVCRVFEVGVHEPAAGPAVRYFTMDLLRGETLSSRLRHKGKLARAEAYPLAAQMADGLQAAHAAGIVHTDFKSGNVILVPGPHGEKAVITDFGLARPTPALLPGGETATMSAFVHVAGTVAYMSPEQLSGGIITPASDIYSFGIVLFEMATGKLPFDDRHLIQSAMQRASGEVDVRALTPRIDQRWETAIFRCLQKDPKDRFASAADLAAWFHEGGGWMASYKYWSRREWIRAAAAAAGAVAVGGGAWYELTRPYQPNAAATEWYRKGQTALQSMTYEAARKALEQAVAADPKFALAHASLARALDEMDYSDQARESMLRAMTVAQETRLTSADQTRLRAAQALVSRDFDRAAPLFQQLESGAPPVEKAAAAIETGWLAEKRDKTAAAATAYQTAVKLDPSYAAAKLRLGFILGRRGGKEDLPAALNAFTEAENLYAASSDYEGITETLLQRANLLNRRSRAAEALPLIEKALGVARTVGNRYQEIRLRLLQGTAIRNTGDAARAAEIAQQAIDQATAEKMDNLATAGLLDLGNSYLIRGDKQTAEEVFRRGLEFAGRGKVRGNEARLRLAVASMYEADRRPEEAKQFIDAALPFFRQGGYRREVTQATTLLGSVYRQLAQFDDAVRLLREALEDALQLQDAMVESDVRQRLSGCVWDQGNWPESILEYQRAIDLLPRAPSPARLNLAELLWLVGRQSDSSKAFDEMAALLKEQPSPSLSRSLARHRAAVYYSEGRLQEASAALAGSDENPESDLLRQLVAIHMGSVHATERATEVARQYERLRKLFDAASAKLRIAEALLTIGSFETGAQLSRESLAFFEPRRIWESVLRSRLVAFRCFPGRTGSGTDAGAARAALEQLRKLWPQADVARYLERPDIRKLSAGVL